MWLLTLDWLGQQTSDSLPRGLLASPLKLLYVGT